MTQYCEVMEQDSTTSRTMTRRQVVRGIVTVIVITVLVGLGTWVGTSFLKDNDSVAPDESELSPAQHTTHLIRSLRISAATATTPDTIDSIPDATADVDPLECGNRFSTAMEDAVVQLDGIDYLASVAGSRGEDGESWRLQQSQAHAGAVALRSLFPRECSPEAPVTYPLDDSIRFADEISMRQILILSDDLIEQWSDLYVIAETPEERDIALAGLWHVISLEAAASPGRSPFALNR